MPCLGPLQLLLRIRQRPAKSWKTYTLEEFLERVEQGDAAAVKSFLDAGMDVNARDKYDKTALMQAAKRGHTKTVEALLANGADVNAIYFFLGETALMMAAAEGHAKTVEALLANGADVNTLNRLGNTALELAAEQASYSTGSEGHAEIVRLLKGNLNIAYTPEEFLTCVEQGDAVAVKSFLDAGTNANAKDDRNWPALTLASKRGHTKTVEALLARGARVNVKDNNGVTALIWAADEGHTKTVEALLASGADVNAENNGGDTALMIATGEGHAEILQLLKKAGAKE